MAKSDGIGRSGPAHLTLLVIVGGILLVSPASGASNQETTAEPSMVTFTFEGEFMFLAQMEFEVFDSDQNSVLRSGAGNHQLVLAPGQYNIEARANAGPFSIEMESLEFDSQEYSHVTLTVQYVLVAEVVSVMVLVSLALSLLKATRRSFGRLRRKRPTSISSNAHVEPTDDMLAEQDPKSDTDLEDALKEHRELFSGGLHTEGDFLPPPQGGPTSLSDVIEYYAPQDKPVDIDPPSPPAPDAPTPREQQDESQQKDESKVKEIPKPSKLRLSGDAVASLSKRVEAPPPPPSPPAPVSFSMAPQDEDVEELIKQLRDLTKAATRDEYDDKKDLDDAFDKAKELADKILEILGGDDVAKTRCGFLLDYYIFVFTTAREILEHGSRIVSKRAACLACINAFKEGNNGKDFMGENEGKAFKAIDNNGEQFTVSGGLSLSGKLFPPFHTLYWPVWCRYVEDSKKLGHIYYYYGEPPGKVGKCTQ